MILYCWQLLLQGRFEILSLTGSFMPSETGGMRNRSGGMSVSLASPDGRVVGGGVAGLLVAASPVQVHILPRNSRPFFPLCCFNNVHDLLNPQTSVIALWF